ncbi:tail fiber assembly protein [Photorhabdus temperata]|uniref:tail fiber assembly protein n=1 Tax=Photorhabdus temperata TaxID=574560 RepID=UPI000389EA35|nr:tail fiber assembly protein [Photorhabdus temperata]EQC00324.1 hypothetical protein B738_11985 [Photorhabdus temperata subsp. temperata M1021]
MKKPKEKWIFDGHKILLYVATKEELIQKAEYDKFQLLTKVNNIVTPLQDAVDLDIATEAEKEALLAWKKYRVMLNRVDISLVPDVKWPEQPK